MGGDADLPPYGRARTPVLHGIIDWVNESEDAAVLQEVADDGWIDPDLLHVGSASRSLGEDDIVQVEPYLLQIVSRALSFVTLTCPTWIENKRPEQRDLHNRLVRKLLDLRWTQLDTLYGWLDEMFRFAEGATVAYYARYTPSPRIVEKAAGHGVVLRALPLSVIPEALLRRHRRFRFMHMTTAQWRELRDMLEAKGRYDLAAVLRAHDTDPT
jgi:hypothetical protein